MEQLYFKWLCQLVCDERRIKSYKKLLRFLYNQDYYYLLDMDSNRGSDGLDLRHQFCYERNYEYSELSSELSDKPCSVLEVMIALAKRFEDQIMYDQDIGDRSPVWFFDMLESLGLSEMDDQHFNEAVAFRIVADFLNRDYEPDGKGGLFYIPGCRRDLREVELWYQACWFFGELL